MAIEANSVNDISNRGATNATLAQFKGKPRQTIVNIDDGYRLVVMDGVTLGGKFKTASLDELNAAKADLQGKITEVKGTADGALTKTQADGYYLGLHATADKAVADASGNTFTTTYATKSELSSVQQTLQTAVDGKAPTSHKHTVSQITDLNSTLANYVTTTSLSQEVATLNSSIAGKANSVHEHGTSAITGLDSTLQSLETALSGKAATAHTHNVSDVTNLQTALDNKSDLTHTHTNYIPKTGSAGTVSVVTTTGTNNKISATSPDGNYSSSSITVSNGTTGTTWTKVVTLTASSPSVSLGSNWYWSGGSAPTLSQNGLLVLGWNYNMGIAVFHSRS